MKDRLLTAVGPLLGAALFALALWVLHRVLRQYPLRDVVAQWHAISGGQLALALVLAGLSYFALTGYDALAFRFIENPLPYPKIALASFLAYVFSHNVGISFFGGSAVRYRFFLSWGVPAGAIARVIAFDVATFWLGFLATGGLVLTLDPVPMPEIAWLPLATSRPLGAILLGLLASVCGAAAALPRRWKLGFVLPRPAMLGEQVLLSSLDWTLAASALYVLLPPAAGLSFGHFLGAYLLSVVLALASHVPAGLGVFESAMVLLLAPLVPGAAVLGSLLAFRVVYYLIPFATAFVLFAVFESAERGWRLARPPAWVGRWVAAVVPRIFGASVLLAGVILLLSGATPAAPGRIEALARVLPLPVLEVSHFLGSAIGVALLLLARALLRRSDAAYFLALALLAAGVGTSLLKGFDYEEAVILSSMWVALLPCRSFFDRKSSLLGQPLSAPWLLGILGVLATTVFVMALAYEGQAYSSELWWQFELSAEASRSMRSLVGAFAVMGCYGLTRLLGPAPARIELPSRGLLERVRPIVTACAHTRAHLALLGDKYLLLHEQGNAFVMYGVERQTWIAMGDPVGPPAQRHDLAWRFRELADRHGGRTAFYEVGTEDLPIYVDLGLSLHKLGEEARVPLAGFSLAGRKRKSLRQSHHRMLREGCSIEIVAPAGVPPLLDAIQAISTAWLAEKKVSEKRFSLGFFDRAYLQALPLVVVRRQARIVAFANLWLGADLEELSVDLMRHDPKELPGVMEYLFAELMLWGAGQGYRWFNLGMAPLAGLRPHRLAPLWHRFGAFVFRRGEPLYGFRGLREFKDKFDPVWEPRFLASPGGLAVPVVLTHVAALIAGGVSGMVAK
jgi:phosphatidylglycerol lysyltransferase